jgi:uncharacterized protein YozE (UPF0346 family)
MPLLQRMPLKRKKNKVQSKVQKIHLRESQKNLTSKNSNHSHAKRKSFYNYSFKPQRPLNKSNSLKVSQKLHSYKNTKYQKSERDFLKIAKDLPQTPLPLRVLNVFELQDFS